MIPTIFHEPFFSYEPVRFARAITAPGLQGFLQRWADFEGNAPLNLKEETDKYVVQMKDADAKNKEVEVNYLKKENALEVHLKHKYEQREGDNYFLGSSSATLRVAFDKDVNGEAISAEVGAEGLIVTVPKKEADPDNVVKVRVSNL